MKYHTEQKETLTDYLRENAARQFSVDEIAAACEGAIGKSTVYRLIKSLEEEGLVRRLASGGSRRVLYQYMPSDACARHLHLKCTVCGKMTHLDCTVSNFLDRQILATNRFVLDDRMTILYGRCASCGEGVNA